MNRQELLEKEVRLLKVSYCVCGHCVFADLYVPHYTVRGDFLPKCELTKESVHYDQTACEDFLDRQLQDLEERFKECDCE